MRHSIFIFFFALANTIGPHVHSQKIDLSGEWIVDLNRDHPEMGDIPATANMEGMIQLPSSLAQQGFGLKTRGADFGVLTPEYKYRGVAAQQ